MNTTTEAAVPTIFHFHESEIREITDVNGEPWFIAKDICDILEISNVTKAMEKVPERHLTLLQVRAGGQLREMNAVDEPGLYRLVLRSDKPQAEPFMEWVTSEVLPAIRRTGFYAAGSRQGQANVPQCVDINEHIAVLKENNTLLKQMMAVLTKEANRRKNFTPDDDAQVLHLHGLGYTPAQIGDTIGRKKDSVRSCLLRLRKKGILVDAPRSINEGQMELFPVGVLAGGER